MVVWVCVALMIGGVLAIVLELLMPGFDGFVSGIVGILALVAAGLLAILFVPGGWLLVLINLSVIALTTGLFFSFIRSKQLEGKIILNESLPEAVPDIDYPGLLGKEGRTVTLLRPYGEADFNGIRVEVSSGGPAVGVGRAVKVVDVQGSKVVVEELNRN